MSLDKYTHINWGNCGNAINCCQISGIEPKQHVVKQLDIDCENDYLCTNAPAVNVTEKTNTRDKCDNKRLYSKSLAKGNNRMTSHVRSGTPPPKCPVHHPNNNQQNQQHSTSTSAIVTQQRSKSLMETLLVAKMEQASLGVKNPFFRTNSLDSTGSMSSSVQSSANSEFCKCDDCLLGIGDSYLGSSRTTQGTQSNKPKVCLYLWHITA